MGLNDAILQIMDRDALHHELLNGALYLRVAGVHGSFRVATRYRGVPEVQ